MDAGLRDARGPITHFAAGGGRCGRKRKCAPETKVVPADCRPYKAATRWTPTNKAKTQSLRPRAPTAQCRDGARKKCYGEKRNLIIAKRVCLRRKRDVCDEKTILTIPSPGTPCVCPQTSPAAGQCLGASVWNKTNGRIVSINKRSVSRSCLTQTDLIVFPLIKEKTSLLPGKKQKILK